jgi:hypothetical protein
MYQQMILEILAEMGRAEIDPRHIEAYMRLEHPTLDGLSAPQFEREVAISVECVDAAGPSEAEACAASFGL